MFKSCSTCVVALILLSACAQEKYVAKPITQESVNQTIAHKSILSDDFNAFLISRGYDASTLPLQSWSLEALTLSAIYHHTDINIAKEKLALAELKLKTAGLKPGIGINTQFSRSNQKNGDIQPWAYGLGIDVPIITNGKQQIKIEAAQHAVEVARLAIAESTWQLRQHLTNDLIALEEAQANIKLINDSVSTHQNLLSLYESRLKHGAASSVEVSRASLLLHNSETRLSKAQANIAPLLKKIANDAGVPYQALTEPQIELLFTKPVLHANNTALTQKNAITALQEKMLLNRLDIRRSLVQYALAESALKLEVAKQIPDISLSPGVVFEFGDTVWSLGLSSLLNLLKQNTVLIEQVKQLRDIEAAQFEGLQSNVIGALSQAYAHYLSSKRQWQDEGKRHMAEQQHFAKLEKQFNAGLIGRLTLTQAKQNINASQQQVLNAKFTLLKSQLAIESILQKPILAQ